MRVYHQKSYSMIHLTFNITNLHCLARWHGREVCISLFERVFYCIYAIPHPNTSLWCQFPHFYIQNEVSHATNLPKKCPFQKVRGDLDCKEEHPQDANQDPTWFYQRGFVATRKVIWSLSLKYLLPPHQVLWRNRASPEEAKPRKTGTWLSVS